MIEPVTLHPMVVWFDNGYTDLISVTPPDATLAPQSKLSADQRGKAPGRRNRNGTWAGYDWRRYTATRNDVRRWSGEGANIGLRAGRFPGVDIDTLDAGLALAIERVALETLGPAPVRFGRSPKRLLMYRTPEPFARMRLMIEDKAGVQHLVEVLGEGQQYLVYGTHPVTRQPYHWTTAVPAASALTAITASDVERFFDAVTAILVADGFNVRREGDGRRQTRVVSRNIDLWAPSMDILREAVALIPNTDKLFPARDDYIRLGYAIRAAAGEHPEEEAYTAFAEWAARHDKDARVAGNPETWRSDWRRMRPPYSVGWDYIAGLARQFGFVDATSEFTTEGAPPDPHPAPAALPPVVAPLKRVIVTDQWLADRVVARFEGRVRYMPEAEKWLAWTGTHWREDAMSAAEGIIIELLKQIGEEEVYEHTPAKERAKMRQHIESASTFRHVKTLIAADPDVKIAAESLDADLWVLNTPGGLVDLRTGERRPSEPRDLVRFITAVGPDSELRPTRWLQFLEEVTGGDKELQAYLQRLAGYGLTGSTDEQVLVFLYGTGGNGKSKFVNALGGMMGAYAKTAAMETFTASYFDRHSTDIAHLMGARLVLSTETQAERRWDEARVKALTGGEPVTARFMRQDNITFVPRFKLIFSGNHKPAIRHVDPAMQRRIHLVPFTHKPPTPDTALGEKLQAEYPGILAWAIAGTRLWLEQGLQPPQIVLDTTEEYMEEQNAFGRWLAERAETRSGVKTSATRLYADWKEWCVVNGEHAGAQPAFGSRLRALYQRRIIEGRYYYQDIVLKEITWPGIE